MDRSDPKTAAGDPLEERTRRQQKELASQFESGQVAAGLQSLAGFFLENGEIDRLFEVRKLQSRLRLGISPVYFRRPPGITSETEREMEQDLAAAALECGQLHAANGNVAAAWNYLRAVDDENAARQAILSAPLSGDQIHAAIEVCLHQKAAPEYGMRLAVQHLGTCSSITLFDSLHSLLAESDLIAAAAVLVRHLAGEIAESTVRRLGLESGEGSGIQRGAELARLMEQHPVAVARSSPHVDPSHLFSILRIGRTQSERPVLELLDTLAAYAALLPESLQYPGDAPFESAAEHHRLWYGALLGRDPERAVAHFCGDPDRFGDPAQRAMARGYGVLLLWRLGRHSDAAKLAAAAAGEPDFHAAQIAPHLIEMASHPDATEIIAEHCARTGDLLGYALAKLSRQDRSGKLHA